MVHLKQGAVSTRPRRFLGKFAMPSLKHIAFLLLLVLLILPTLSTAQWDQQHTFERASSAGSLENFDEIIELVKTFWSVPGLAVSIVQGGEVIYAKGFGKKNNEEGGDVTPDTLFPIASCTKAFTSLAVAQIIDDGKIDWETPLQKYVPDFRLYDTVATDHVNVLDLLSHRTGLPSHVFSWYYYNITRKEVVHNIRYLEPNADFRTIFQYNNQMFVMAGQIIEEVTGITWEDHIESRILTPLNMSRTGITVKRMTQQDDHSLGYFCKELSKDGNCLSDPEVRDYYVLDSAMAPAGAIYSSVNDMSNWLLYLLSRGQTVDLVSPEGFEKLLTPQMVVPVPNRPTWWLSQLTYALGWTVAAYKGRPLVWHEGRIDGFSSITAFFPEDDLGISVLTNLENSVAGAKIVFLAVDVIFNLPQTESILDRLQQQSELPSIISLSRPSRTFTSSEDFIQGTCPSRKLRAYTGHYEHPAYGILDITLNDRDVLHVTRRKDIRFINFDLKAPPI